MVSDVRFGNRMLEMPERSELNGDRSIIEQDMAVRTDTKQVVAYVAAVVRAPERPDVMCLAIRLATHNKPSPA